MALIIGSSLASCSSEEELINGQGDRPLTFSSSITTRAAGTAWDAGDEIGIYMIDAGTTLSADNPGSAGGNVPYATAAGDGRFTPTGAGLSAPAGSRHDFVAYYPYTAATTGATYRVDVSDQSIPEAIDLLYADNLRSFDAAAGNGTLAFTHQLARLSLTLVSADGSDLSEVGVSLTGAPLQADFDLGQATFTLTGDTGTVVLPTGGSATRRTASALLIPTETTDGLRLRLTTGDGRSIYRPLPDGFRLEKGTDHTFTVDVANADPQPSTDPADYPRWTETPLLTEDQLTADGIRYLTHYIPERPTVRNYSLLYDTNFKLAYWVAYPLCNYYTRHNTDRTDTWTFDPELSREDQADMRSGLGGGYDRGHQIPSADRLVTAGANEQTFYFTNMTAQLGRQMNQTIWSDLEGAVRGWSSNIDTLYVVTGAMPASLADATVKYTTDCSGQPIAVPKFYFKALAYVNRRTGEARTIAFKLDHQPYSSRNYMDYAISVKELEEETGFTFFPDIDARYKASFNAAQWP